MLHIYTRRIMIAIGVVLLLSAVVFAVIRV